MNYTDDYHLGAQHIWLPYTQMLNHLPQLEVVKTKKTQIYLKNNKVLIDGISSWWAVCHGYNHPHIVKNIISQVKKLPHIMLAGFANSATYQLAHRLANFCKMDKVFFSDSGSTAIEVAMKITWQYHINCGNKDKTKFISFKNSYHGDTTGAMSLADLQSGMHQKFNHHLLKNFCLDIPINNEDFINFEKFIIDNNNIIAGLFIEPLVQCAGGMKFHSTNTLTSQEIFDKFLDDSLDKALMHGPTFMGNALACSASNASLDLFEKYDYEKMVNKIANFFAKNLKRFKKFPRVIDTRYIGAIAVIELNINWQEIKIIRQKFIEKGVFLRPFGNVIYIMPSLNISAKNLKIIFQKIEEVLIELR